MKGVIGSGLRIEIVIAPFSRIGMLINTGGRRLARIRPATKGQIYIRQPPSGKLNEPAILKCLDNILFLTSYGTQFSHHLCRALPKVALEFTTEWSQHTAAGHGERPAAAYFQQYPRKQIPCTRARDALAQIIAKPLRSMAGISARWTSWTRTVR